jgi:hypothetical protein
MGRADGGEGRRAGRVSVEAWAAVLARGGPAAAGPQAACGLSGGCGRRQGGAPGSRRRPRVASRPLSGGGACAPGEDLAGLGDDRRVLGPTRDAGDALTLELDHPRDPDVHVAVVAQLAEGAGAPREDVAGGRRHQGVRRATSDGGDLVARRLERGHGLRRVPVLGGS